MSNSLIQNKLLRCEVCFMLRKIIIEPDYPQTTVSLECLCGEFREDLDVFVSELLQNANINFICGSCGKEDPKNSIYCDGCHKIYCESCSKNDIATNKDSKTPHHMINANDFDFHCILHHEEFLCGYCMNCSVNICKTCINEKIHKGHRFVKYNKIMPSSSQEMLLGEYFKLSESKIENNKEMFEMLISKQNNAELKKQLVDVYNATNEDNKYILQLVKYLLELYQNHEHKNYALIHNLTENMKFNPTQFNLNKNASIDQQTLDFLEYAKREFILFKRFGSKTRSNTIMPAPLNRAQRAQNKPISKPTEKPIPEVKDETKEKKEAPKETKPNNISNKLNIFNQQQQNTSHPENHPAPKKLQINPIFTKNTSSSEQKKEEPPKKLKINPIFQNQPAKQEEKPKPVPGKLKPFVPPAQTSTTATTSTNPPPAKIGDKMKMFNQPKTDQDVKKGKPLPGKKMSVPTLFNNPNFALMQKMMGNRIMGAPMAKKEDKPAIERSDEEDPNELIMNKPMYAKNTRKRKPTRKVMMGEEFVIKEKNEEEEEEEEDDNKHEEQKVETIVEDVNENKEEENKENENNENIENKKEEVKEEVKENNEEAVAEKKEEAKEENNEVKEEASEKKEEIPPKENKEEAPTNNEEKPINNEEVPTNNEEAAEKKEEVPTNNEEKPTNNEEVTTNNEEAVEKKEEPVSEKREEEVVNNEEVTEKKEDVQENKEEEKKEETPVNNENNDNNEQIPEQKNEAESTEKKPEEPSVDVHNEDNDKIKEENENKDVENKECGAEEKHEIPEIKNEEENTNEANIQNTEKVEDVENQ